MVSRAYPISDTEWQARDDAHTLAQAEEVKADPARLKKAKKAAINIAEERKEDLKAINKVVDKPSGDSDEDDIDGDGQDSKKFNVFKKI